jgi:hypothetical protein
MRLVVYGMSREQLLTGTSRGSVEFIAVIPLTASAASLHLLKWC